MDCQMPEMDGFEATRAIRKHENDRTLSRGKKGRIPIIALTANAIKGDRERCLESGMDNYLTKPLDPDRLVAAIETHVANADEAPPVSSVGISDEPPPKTGPAEDSVDRSPADASAPFNLDALFKRWGTNKAFAEKLIVMFCKQAPGDLGILEQAVAAGDVEEATRLAHGLKGAASYVSADALRAVAARLEEMGRGGDLSDAEACIIELRTELQRCLECGSTRFDATEPQHANPNC
jgi:HPt (histidine-containing phosphotransfer) domain-containing protein